MKFCEYHEMALRAALTVRGLNSFCADPDDYEHREHRVHDLWLTNTDVTVDTFEPYIMAMMGMTANIARSIGPAALAPNDDGSERCPMCFVDAAHKQLCRTPQCDFSVDLWIGPAADEMKAIAEGLRS